MEHFAAIHEINLHILHFSSSSYYLRLNQSNIFAWLHTHSHSSSEEWTRPYIEMMTRCFFSFLFFLLFRRKGRFITGSVSTSHHNNNKMFIVIPPCGGIIILDGPWPMSLRSKYEYLYYELSWIFIFKTCIQYIRVPFQKIYAVLLLRNLF